MYIKNKRGQSTVEYVLLATAVIAVIIALVGTKGSQFQTQLNSTLNTAIGDLSPAAETLSNSHQPTGVAGSGTPPYGVKVTP